MKERRISNAELSRGTGIKTNTISDWKTKGTNPSADNIVRICDFLQISTDYLLTGKDNSPPSLSLRDDELELLRYYNALTILERGKVLARMEDKVKDLNTEDLQGRVG